MQDLAHIPRLPPPVDPRPGVVLRETYRLERMLGEGGMGTVYEASHLRLRRRFAVKVLSPRLARQQDQLERFRREAEITSELGHPNIVEVMDFNLTDDGTAFIVMELLRGENLSQRLEREGRLGLARTMRFLQQAASALQAVHAAGVVHRDLKPSNLFLNQRDDGSEIVKLLDFGISKVKGASTLTGDDLLGTPYYMSPEQAEGRHYLVDLRTDVFSMGAILYRMLSGRRPFEADTVPAMLFQIVHQPATPLYESDAGIPHKIAEVVEVAMAKDPNQRFQSMKLLAEAFTTVVEMGDTVCGGRSPTRTLPAAGGMALTPGSMPRPVARPTPESVPRPVMTPTPGSQPPTEERIWRPTTRERRLHANVLGLRRATSTLHRGSSTLHRATPPTTIPIPPVEDASSTRPGEEVAGEKHPVARKKIKHTVALTLAGLAAVAVVVVALTVGGRGWTTRAAAGPLKLQGSLAGTTAALDRALKARPCDARRALARAMLATGEPDRQRQVLERLLECTWLDEAHAKMARALLQGTRADGLHKAAAMVPAAASATAEGELIRAYLLARAGQQTAMLRALDRWHSRRQADAGQAWFSPDLALSMIAAAAPHGVPPELLRQHSGTLPALASQGQRALAAGNVAAARAAVEELRRQSKTYEPGEAVRARVLLSERRLSDARTSASRLAANTGLWGQRGHHLLADVLVAQGRVKEAVETLKTSISRDSLERPSLAAGTAMRLGDLCRVMRRRGCARSAYLHAVVLARRAGDRPRAEAARAMAMVMESKPGKAPSPELKKLLARLREAPRGEAPPASELDCVSAWADLRQGKRLAAARKFQRVAKGSEAFARFRLMAAESMLSLGRPEDVLQLLKPLVASPGSAEATHFGVAGLYVATRAARMAGRNLQAARLAEAFLVHWGSVEADLLESRAWRGRVLAVRAELAKYRRRGAVLYGNGVTVGLVSGARTPATRAVEERLAQLLRRRYQVKRLRWTAAADRRWEQGRAPLAQPAQALVKFKPVTTNGRTSLQLRRLDAATLQEVTRATLPLPATEADLGKAALALFPRSKDPLLYGGYVAGVFLRCNRCLRSAARDEGASASGAELTLAFDGTGRMLPSRVTKVVPDTARLTVCLRACVERLPLPPFGDREDRLTVGVQVSLEPRWAMLRTVPKLELE